MGCPGGSSGRARTIERLGPDRSDKGSIPARGPLQHVLPSISHTFLPISLSIIKQKMHKIKRKNIYIIYM